MSTTVSYKGETLTTVSNATKTLQTEGKYLEDDITLVDVSGGGAVLTTKNISANGTYNASSDSADGYSQVNVSVPASAVDSGTKSITANGNGQDVVGYAAVNVNVPNTYSAGDDGKVVSNGALVAQGSDTVTANDTYDTTLINSLTVNVSGGGTTPTGFLNETVITATEGVSGSNNSLSLMQTLEPELMENGNRHFYLFFFLNNSLTNKAALFSWCVHQTNTSWFYGSCRHANGTLTWLQGNSHDFWYSAGTEIHILEFDSLLGLGA